jgi:hypothetical protein
MLGISYGNIQFNKNITFQTINDDKFFTFPGYTGNISTINEIIKSKSDSWPKHGDYLRAVLVKFESLLLSIHTCISEPTQENIDLLFSGSASAVKSKKNINNTVNPLGTPKLADLLKTPQIKDESDNSESMIWNLKKSLLVEVQKGQLATNKNINADSMPFEKPVVEVEINHPQLEDKINYPTRYVKETHAAGDDICPIWCQVLEFDISKIVESPESGSFTIRLLYSLKNSKRTQQVGQDVSYLFSELKNQEICEKIINIKAEDGKKIVAQILLRSQLAWDIMGLLRKWRNELEIKVEIINRLLDRIDEIQRYSAQFPNKNSIITNNHSESRRNEKSQINQHNTTHIGNSLISFGNSTMNNSGLYDNPYVIK